MNEHKHDAHGGHSHGEHIHSSQVGHDLPAHEHDHFKTYLTVFIALGVLTVMSFGAYGLFKPEVSMWVILAISVVKATLVAMIFMHLKFDWPRLYCIVIPVCVMAVMMIIVFLPDMVVSWHRYFYNP